MQKTIEVVYENGVFKPLETVELKEGEKDTGCLMSVRLSRARRKCPSRNMAYFQTMLFLIAATCKHHGINKIATFDTDFKRVDFLEVITPE